MRLSLEFEVDFVAEITRLFLYDFIYFRFWIFCWDTSNVVVAAGIRHRTIHPSCKLKLAFTYMMIGIVYKPIKVNTNLQSTMSLLSVIDIKFSSRFAPLASSHFLPPATRNLADRITGATPWKFIVDIHVLTLII